MKKQYDIFVKIWNSYRLIEQKDLHLPTGILNSIFSFPESYGGAKDGFQVNLDLLREVAKMLEVLQENQDFLDVPLGLSL